MIVVQAFLFWYLSEAVVFPILVALISLPAVLWRHRWNVSSFNLPFIDLGLAIVCAMKWYLMPHDPRTVNGFVMYPLVHAAGQFFLLVQVARLWARRSDRPLPVYLPVLGVLVFICLGDVDVTRWQRAIYQHGSLAFVGLTCAYFATARRRHASLVSSSQRWLRPAVITAILIAATFATRAGNASLLRQWSDIERLMANAAKARSRQIQTDSYIGFTPHAPLGSLQLLKNSSSNDVALRVESIEGPGYLRGAVFDVYTGLGWETNITWPPLSFERTPLTEGSRTLLKTGSHGQSHRPMFALKPFSQEEHHPMTIWRESAVDQFIFLPGNVSCAELPAQKIHIDRHGQISTAGLPAMASITMWLPSLGKDTPVEKIVQSDRWQPPYDFDLTDEQVSLAFEKLTQLPLSIDPRIVELASQIFEGCESPIDKVQAVKRYFSDYRYQLSIQIPPGRNPLTHFLLKKPAASCEFFASGTAVLLRLGGVPTRYVTGFVGGDYNALGRYWIVRQKEAHAWVEAYLPEKGWQVVDSTPGDGVPETKESFSFWHVLDELNLRGQMIRSALAGGGFYGILLAIKLLVLLVVDTIPGRLMIGGCAFLLVRKVRFRKRVRTTVKTTQAVTDLRRLLAEMDRQLRRLRLERAAHETLHQFAERVRAAAITRPTLTIVGDWYLHYASVRYNGSTPAATNESLRNELQRVKADLDKK